MASQAAPVRGILAISIRFCEKISLTGNGRLGAATRSGQRSSRPLESSLYFPDTTTMPYFVYKVSPTRQLTYIDTKERYQEARTLARELRAKAPADEDGEFRLIFANQQGEAEKLLSTPRDERVIGED